MPKASIANKDKDDMKIISKILDVFLPPEAIGKLIAKLIASLLRRASKSKQWDRIRQIVSVVAKALSLFEVCYNDDTMDEKDEERIAEAIEHLTDGVDIEQLLKK